MNQPKVTSKFDIWHLGIPVDDLKKTVDFYTKHLGFTFLFWDEIPTKHQGFVCTKKGGFTLEFLMSKDGTEREKPKRPDHISFECEDIETFREQVIASGFSAVSPLKTFESGIKTFNLIEINGITLQFFQGRSKYETKMLAALEK